MTDKTTTYFIAAPSGWPIMGAMGLFSLVLGFVQVLHDGSLGPWLMLCGCVLLIATITGWFGAVINESLAGLHSAQMDRTYRYGMMWFIVSEVFLFGVFFAALFYARIFALPELGHEPVPFLSRLFMQRSDETHALLWPQFQATWPLLTNPNPALFKGPAAVIPPFGIPALNTLLLLSSALCVTIAHWGLKANKRLQLLLGLSAGILLGLSFESLQVYEYWHAHEALGLTLSSGIYGTTFYTLTGLHAMHVTVGLIMLSVILVRCLKRHFQPEHHFAFEAVSWYWHFVDVVWLFLFVFVYWL
ncbi:MAG TPA: cytochrome c oxidase subunit 3 [Gammaproteobacteria bacterium]|nr:cytochrome c oxidase subunit 3 [Gammaproteobacteria bacterium]